MTFSARPEYAQVDARDAGLIQIVDAAMAEAARRSGPWLVCRPGCNQCCHGAFAINQLDAHRLRRGLTALTLTDPERAARVLQRALAAVARMAPEFPGDPVTGLLLAGGEEGEKQFADSDDDEPCPALDPTEGTCDLYDWRPMTCRVFGPPVRTHSTAVGICELCFEGASDQEITACLVDADADGLEPDVLEELERSSGVHGMTIVAYSLAT
jgi:Fe-S-cluster containining protein